MANGQRTVEMCRAKADECRVLARQAKDSDERETLEQVAKTWERIAIGLEYQRPQTTCTAVISGTNNERAT